MQRTLLTCKKLVRLVSSGSKLNQANAKEVELLFCLFAEIRRYVKNGRRIDGRLAEEGDRYFGSFCFICFSKIKDLHFISERNSVRLISLQVDILIVFRTLLEGTFYNSDA